MPHGAGKRDSVKSLGKALHLIDIINQARTPMTLMSLSQVSGYPKSTVYALLNTLRSYDCIRQGSDGRYYLGTRLFEWGCGVSASWELNNVARPYLEKLAAHTDATALLSRIEGNSVVVIDQSTAMCGGIYVTTEIGTLLPLHATSQGKLLLAALLLLPVLCACGKSQTGYNPLSGVETTFITDSCDRKVEVPAEITRIAPSGGTAQMLLMPIAYDLLVGLSSSPSTAQRPYFPEELWYSLLFEAEGCVSRQIVIPRDFTGVLDTLLLRQAGDVNLDGQLDVYDLQLLYERVAGLVLLKEDYALLLADVNQDGLRNAQDVQRLYEQLTGTV